MPNRRSDVRRLRAPLRVGSSRAARRSTPLIVLLVALLLVPGAAVASNPAPTAPARAPDPATVLPAAPLAAAQLAHRLSAEVYGYLPYWELDSGTGAYLHYDLLTDLALFSVGVTSTGAINTAATGYTTVTGSNARTIVANAHAAGVRVDMTFTSFGLAKNAAFFSDATAMSTALAALAGFVKSMGLDGINVDVEEIDNAYFPAYATFVGQLRTALQLDNPIARVSVATNGSISGASMANQAIANGADRAVMMGYAYRTAGTSPVGSISPLARTDGGKSLTWTLDTYASVGVAPGKILLGLPYYGRSWATDSGNLHATNLGSPGIFYPGSELATIPPGTTINTDAVEQSRWFALQDSVTGAWNQTYFDDPTTLAAKYALATNRRLAGVALWALGYDRGLTTYWSALAGSFGTIRVSGADRYATSAAIAAQAFAPGVDTVFVATGLNFPDAVAGSAAAARLGGPLLLVTSSAIPEPTATALARLLPRRIVIVGGPAAVSDAVAAALVPFAGLGGVVRAGGADRYETAASLSAVINPVGVPVVYVASGADFPDALTAAPAAAHESGALLLTSPTLLSPPAAAELTRMAPARVVIVGGPSAVSDAVLSAVAQLLPGATVERRAGPDRYATAAAISAVFTDHVPAIWIASGLGFADAVSAAAAASVQGGPLLLAGTNSLPAVTNDAIIRLAPAHAAVAGGPSVVSDAVLGAVRAAVATAS